MGNLISTDNPHTWHTGTDYTHVTLTHVRWDSDPAIDVAFFLGGLARL